MLLLRLATLFEFLLLSLHLAFAQLAAQRVRHDFSYLLLFFSHREELAHVLVFDAATMSCLLQLHFFVESGQLVFCHLLDSLPLVVLIGQFIPVTESKEVLAHLDRRLFEVVSRVL